MWSRGERCIKKEISRCAYVQIYRPKTLPRTLLILPDTGLAGAAADVDSLLSPRRRCLNVRRILGSSVVTLPFEVAVDDAAGVESISLACRLAAFFSSMFLIILAFSMLVKIVLFSRFAWLISACSLCALDAFSYAKLDNKSERYQSVNGNKYEVLKNAAKEITDSLGEVVPFELWEVFDVPHIVMVETLLAAANDGRVQRLGHLLCNRLVLELDPPFCKVLLLVASILFATRCHLWV